MSTPSAKSIREKFKKVIQPSLRPAISQHEVDLHFSSMPDRYWSKITVDELLSHLEMQHQYLERAETADRNLPVLKWRHFLESDYSEVIVMTWNRHGLLAKVAGSFAAAKVNIIEADVYTREDNVVLDVFKVCDAEYRRINDEKVMEKVLDTIVKTLSLHGDLPFEEMTESSMGSDLTSKPVEPTKFKTKVEFENGLSDPYTTLSICAKDHLGLLHDILQVLALSDVDIKQAKIDTEDGVAVDSFQLTDTSGKKISDLSRLDEIRNHLLEMIRPGGVIS